MSKLPFNSGDYQNSRQKMIADGLNKLGVGKKERHDPVSELVFKSKTLATAVQNQIKPILKAGGWKDKPALRATIATLFVQGLHEFSKEELENLCTIFHLEAMMESIEASPWGDDKPDLLSGQ